MKKIVRESCRWSAPRRLATLVTAFAISLIPTLSAPIPLTAQSVATEYDGAAALGLALRRLGPTERVLMLAAHPDDENTAILAALALGEGLDVAYLSLTRGEGGQNGIGPELQEALGIIRTEELLAARRLDGAHQYFTRAYDYGFSKSAAEAFEHWPADSILADAVAVIREFRPDIVVSIFSGTPADGHGQHQAAGIIAHEAFTVAGDPTRFPEQIAQGLRPHSPARLFQARWWGGEAGIALETGRYDPLLGASYHQIALASRGRHRSQDMGRALVPGPQRATLQWIAGSEPGEPSLFAGLETSLSERALRLIGPGRAPISDDPSPENSDSVLTLLSRYDGAVPRLRAIFNPLSPGELVPDLVELIGLLETANHLTDDEVLSFHIGHELADLRHALALAAGVIIDATSNLERITPGEEAELELVVWNGGDRPLNIERLEPVLPPGWKLSQLPESELASPAGGPDPLEPGRILTRRFRLRAPADTEFSEPYYLRSHREGDIYRWPDDVGVRGLPFEPPTLLAGATISLEGTALDLEREIEYRAVSTTEGESRRPILITPPVSIALEPEVIILPTGSSDLERGIPLSIQLMTDAGSGVVGEIGLEVPPGWSVEPARIPVTLESAGERRNFDLYLTPPSDPLPGTYYLRATFTDEDGSRYDRGYEVIDYPHIRPRPIYRDATAMVQHLDLRVAEGLRVAYIPGAGDAIPEALEQLGISVRIIDPADIATTDLSTFDTIVLGIRAYEHQPELPLQNRRLLEFVEGGGTLIVQYNQYRFSGGGFAPYPLTIARPHDRVTDEGAPVELLVPTHPALSWPNRIGEGDFDGWVQERGLYFAHSWDDRYTPLLALSDPGEEPLQGGLLIAEYGKGTYIYTGIAFFRQLPAGVPGAYRLFANLISIGARR